MHFAKVIPAPTQIRDFDKQGLYSYSIKCQSRCRHRGTAWRVEGAGECKVKECSSYKK